MIEPYTTGFNTDINVGAKKWLKQMRAQCDYGNGATPPPPPPDPATDTQRFLLCLQKS